ncbi:MBL fold metallo-hydrolase [Alicyclobacillus shizuokensis]|uniref:MBL fold metallo-hydrolase n=1 Tax=Alicyclobacillus shizuokensis TaxID=392014 RepID=UPI000833BF20|nr:MBL fold metallo-hydrolase [Alicyclobacillus shizuokensis]
MPVQESNPVPVRVSEHVWQVPFPTPTLPPLDHTNTYVIATGDDCLLVDLGTTEERHLSWLTQFLRNLGVQRLQIIATHHHVDHTAGLPRLAAQWQVPIHLHPLDHPPARQALGVPPELLQPTPAQLQLAELSVIIRHQPGHTHGHLHVEVPADGVILVGDHLSGAGTVWIGPPDGHMDDYLTALTAIAQSGCSVAGPGHGPTLDARAAALQTKERRLRREAEILSLVSQRPLGIRELRQRIYGDSLPAGVERVARRTLLAHVQRLLDAGKVRAVWQEGRFLYSTEP